MDELISDLEYLVGNKEVDFEEIYNRLTEHYPSLTKKELISIAASKNLLALQVNNEPLKLRRKSDKPVPLPPNKNPSRKR